MTDLQKQMQASSLSRRRFVAGAGAAAAAVSVINPQAVFGTNANSKIEIGMIGCGNRGTWIAELFQAHGGYHVTAAADYFQDRVHALSDKLDVLAANRFTGLDGYRQLLAQPLDAVVIESPPYFHPSQAAAAVEAGKHVYLAKPIAVDVPGCKTVEQSGKDATAKGRCFLVDFQTRANEYFREAIGRVHDGAIGRFAFGEATYHAGIPWMGQVKYLLEQPHHPEARLRAWGLDKVLSGDIITEQNIHTLDVASWIMDQPPQCAFGTGARKVREWGDCYDTFSVTYRYPDNVGMAFSSRQFNGHGTQPVGINNRMFGSEGVLETKYGGDVRIRGKNFYKGGNTSRIYQQGAVNNIAAFHQRIHENDVSNATVAASVRSNLVTILGRTAAYTGNVVTWEQLLADTGVLAFDLDGLRK